MYEGFSELLWHFLLWRWLCWKGVNFLEMYLISYLSWPFLFLLCFTISQIISIKTANLFYYNVKRLFQTDISLPIRFIRYYHLRLLWLYWARIILTLTWQLSLTMVFGLNEKKVVCSVNIADKLYKFWWKIFKNLNCKKVDFLSFSRFIYFQHRACVLWTQETMAKNCLFIILF